MAYNFISFTHITDFYFSEEETCFAPRTATVVSSWVQ